ncbi:MAG TPA: PHP-associated domain-containing protein [Candidatus Limnocylindria bacterium]|nr:PHP-associated domain-containing protein [Candidatus Limnocylindria bacterium]
MSDRVRLDMHTHTTYSKDSRASLESFAAGVRRARLGVVCVTDHDTIEGAQRLREMADGFDVVVGEEISSADGDLIGLFLERAVPSGLSAEDTIARIREQGGVVSVPHPFSRNRRGRIRRDALHRVARLVDCVEVFNARELLRSDNARAAGFAVTHGIRGAVGSDAHRPWELGRTYLEVTPFRMDREGFLAALDDAEVKGELAGVIAHAITRYDVLRKWLARIR